MDYEPGGELGGTLGNVVNYYENGYLNHWGLQNPDKTPALSDADRETHRYLKLIGERLRACLSFLSTDQAFADAVRGFLVSLSPENADVEIDLDEFGRVFAENALVSDSLRIALGYDATETLLSTAEARAPHLAGLLARRRLGERALVYLSRATRSYLWGFDAECVVMCRSTLEAALEQRLADHLDPDRATPSLAQLLEQVGELGFLQGFRRLSRRKWEAVEHSDLWRADQVRRVANDVVHNWPDPVVPGAHSVAALAVLADLTETLGLLFPATTAS